MKQTQNVYYNYRTIDGYNAPINVIISKRGLGKTFGRVRRSIFRFMCKERQFIYVVETEDMVKELSQNKGDKFFSKQIEYLKNHPNYKNNKLLEFLEGNTTELTEGDVFNKIKGGTIIIGGKTAGYIVSLNGFAKLKRNNFVNVGEIIIDEFIPETIDVRSMRNTYKMVSLIQSIARTDNVKIYLLGNSVRLNDDILLKLKLTNLKPGEFRVVKDKYGVLVVCHYVSNEQYKAFTEIADRSVAGRLAKLTGQDNLEENKFANDIDETLLIPDKPKASHFIFCLHGEAGSIRIHTTKDRSEYYVFEDYGKNINNRYCFDKRFITPVVKFYDIWKDVLLNAYSKGNIKFQDGIQYIIFKNILKLDLNH